MLRQSNLQALELGKLARGVRQDCHLVILAAILDASGVAKTDGLDGNEWLFDSNLTKSQLSVVAGGRYHLDRTVVFLSGRLRQKPAKVTDFV